MVGTLSKKWLLEGNLNNMFDKISKWMGKCLGCIDVEFFDYNTLIRRKHLSDTFYWDHLYD
jgi:hypothetical protein